MVGAVGNGGGAGAVRDGGHALPFFMALVDASPQCLSVAHTWYSCACAGPGGRHPMWQRAMDCAGAFLHEHSAWQ